jgi:insertion element IS1 protein InsB
MLLARCTNNVRFLYMRQKTDLLLDAAVSAFESLLLLSRFYTDGWGAYERPLDPEQHISGKAHTQQIESQHSNVRTRIKRLVRRTLCFSKTTTMHDLVLGLFINRDECGGAL